MSQLQFYAPHFYMQRGPADPEPKMGGVDYLISASSLPPSPEGGLSVLSSCFQHVQYYEPLQYSILLCFVCSQY